MYTIAGFVHTVPFHATVKMFVFPSLSAVLPEMEKTRQNHSLDMIFFMLTNIIAESSELICSGNEARENHIQTVILSCLFHLRKYCCLNLFKLFFAH